MLRRAFTLIELLVVIAIIGTMTTLAVVSLAGGRSAARLKGSVRDVFATIRLARSMALVTQKPCIVTFSTQVADDTCQSSALITSAELLKSRDSAVRARSLGGEWITLGEEDEPEPPAGSGRQQQRDKESGESASSDEGGGQTVEEILFEPASEEVFKDICLKVVMDDEVLETAPGDVDEAKRSMISTFSNVDYILGKYEEQRTKRKDEAEGEAAKDQEREKPSGKASAKAESEERSLVWQVNGRCDAHRIYVYRLGGTPEDGWVVRVDKFGAAKIFAPGEAEE